MSYVPLTDAELEDAELVAKMMVIASFMGGGGAEDRAADYLRRLVAEVRERRANDPTLTVLLPGDGTELLGWERRMFAYPGVTYWQCVLCGAKNEGGPESIVHEQGCPVMNAEEQP
jgi:hypothetical protein